MHALQVYNQAVGMKFLDVHVDASDEHAPSRVVSVTVVVNRRWPHVVVVVRSR